MNTILLIISLGIFLIYNGYIYYKYGLLPSISDSYYKLPEKYRIFFTLFIWFFILPIIIVSSTPLMFFAGSAIMFVGAAPKFLEDHEKLIHFISAIIGMVLSLFSMIIDFKVIIAIPILLFNLFLFLKKPKNYIWWIEVITFLTIISILFYNNF